jgi:hypothetical protein
MSLFHNFGYQLMIPYVSIIKISSECIITYSLASLHVIIFLFNYPSDETTEAVLFSFALEDGVNIPLCCSKHFLVII